jgi:alginate O-acetyltransferase complex protein AlgI
MIFTSLTFLVFFAVLLLGLAVVKTSEKRQAVLLVASYIFYGFWNVSFLLLIFTSSCWGWFLGAAMVRARSTGTRRLYLMLSLILTIGTLGFFKYADFTLGSLSAVFGIELPQLDILLPVGISFFLFQTMRYTIDLYRGTIVPEPKLGRFLLFVSFFPQLVAGPIVRASEFLPQLSRPVLLTKENFIIGSQLFLGGVLQKVLIADNLSRFVDPVFAEPAFYSGGTLWLAMFSYALQIFCDFSGYSLMAIGIARVLGFQLPENFRMPYGAGSIVDFWNRWHISLSTWLRDYLYISLGGNRKGERRTYVNLMLTMLIGGLWHGASWNFVVWGGLHGLGLVVYRLWIKTETRQRLHQTCAYKIAAWVLTLFFVCLLWIPFRSADFDDTYIYAIKMLTFADGVQWMHSPSVWVLCLGVLWHLVYRFHPSVLSQFATQHPAGRWRMFCLLVALMLIVMFAPLETSPFIYFQF